MVVCQEFKEKKRAFCHSLIETWESLIMGVYYTQEKINSQVAVGCDRDEGGVL